MIENIFFIKKNICEKIGLRNNKYLSWLYIVIECVLKNYLYENKSRDIIMCRIELIAIRMPVSCGDLV